MGSKKMVELTASDDGEKAPKRHKSPLETWNIFSFVCFFWMDSTIWSGYKGRLTSETLPKMPSGSLAEENLPRIKQAWDKLSHHGTVKPTNGQFLRMIMGLTPLRLIILSCIQLFIFGTMLLVMSGAIVTKFIGWLSDPTLPYWHGWVYCASFFVCLNIQTLVVNHSFFNSMRAGLVHRASLLAFIYAKALKLENVTSSVGEIVNLQSNDVQRIVEFFKYGNFLWFSPCLVIAATGLIVSRVGWGPGMAGFGIVLLLIPIQSALGSLMSSIKTRTIPITDSRIRLMNEIMGAIKLVKLYAWEDSFALQTQQTRSAEVEGLRLIAIVKGLNYGYAIWSSPFVVFVTFSIYTSLRNSSGNFNLLTSATVFTVVAIFNVIKFPFGMIPLAVKSYAEAMVGCTRLVNFFMMPELVDSRTLNLKSKKPGIALKNCTFRYKHAMRHDMNSKKDKKMKKRESSIMETRDTNEAPFSMNEISFKTKPGELVAVVGTVGSGKSTLLQGILGQTPLADGKLIVKGSLCYVPQSAWLLNQTLRDNILFGLPYDEEKYNQTISVCQLLPDLEQLPDGDNTEIGERGINLSGGQKQRISLARAVYALRDVYLLDDPLSAVDQYVGNALFNQVIKGALLGKTIILVTNQLQYLPQCDRIIFLKNGQISEMGSYQELSEAGQGFAEMLKEHRIEDNQDYLTKRRSASSLTDSTSSIKSRKSEVEVVKDSNVQKGDSKASASQSPEKGKLVMKEDSVKGGLSLSVVGEYFSAGGILLTIIVAILFVTSQGAGVVSDWYLSYWTAESAKPNLNNKYHIGNWSALLSSFIILMVLRYILFAILSLRAATLIHNRVFKSVLRAPLGWFDATPIGRILNRFTKDQDSVDDLLPDAMHQCANSFLVILSSILLVCVIFPWFAIAIVPFAIWIFVVVYFYRPTSREIKRIDGTTRSPIFAHLSATLQGLAAIRAYGASDSFQSQNFLKIDSNNASQLYFEGAARWLALRIDFSSSILVTVSAIVATALKGDLSSATAGLAVSYSLGITGLFQWGIRQLSETEAHLTSVERLLSYTKLPQEAPAIIPDHRPPSKWPKKPSLEYEKVEVKYAPHLDPALNKISFKIKPREKVGIVGRTGSGKSTLTLTLFRILELTHGKIKIDGVDISKIGLEDLRKHLAIVPQDPVLFKATVRYNLDPLGEHDDHALWKALEKSHLKEVIAALPGGLDGFVQENGDNFSSGQRQLLCIARAVLRQCKILVLDEASSSIDMQTDVLVQQTIRSVFKHCTVLSIAHRLHTIIDSDKILLLEKGVVKEFASPKELLADPESEFSKLVDETGPETSKHLRRIANGEEDLYEGLKAMP